MQNLPLVFLFTLGATSVLADPPPPVPPTEAKALPAASLTTPAEKPLTIVGTWDCTQPDWSGPVELRADGTLTQDGKPSSNRWLLAVRDGRVQLFLQWRDYPAQTVSMINADEFAGQVHNGELRLRRRAPAVPAAPATPALPPTGTFGNVEIRAWHQGEPPLKLIRQDEGFCALSVVAGHFQGGGETVKVYVGEDGYWYLGGESQQEGVAAECIVVRNRK